MRRTSLNLGWVALSGLVVACGASGGPPAATRQTTESARAAESSKPPAPHEEHAVGAFAALRLATFDPFPDGPSSTAWRDTASYPRPWSWVVNERNDGSVWHQVTVSGRPDDLASELLARAGGPRATLPPNGGLLFRGKQWGDGGEWSFASVAVVGPPVLMASDIESCAVTDVEVVDGRTTGNVRTMEPALRIRWNAEGKRKLAALGPEVGLCAAFGEAALSLAFYPGVTAAHDFTSDFPVEDEDHQSRVARARKLAAACLPVH